MNNVGSGVEKEDSAIAVFQQLKSFVIAVVPAAGQHDDDVRCLRLIYDQKAAGIENQNQQQQQATQTCKEQAPRPSHDPNVLFRGAVAAVVMRAPPPQWAGIVGTELGTVVEAGGALLLEEPRAARAMPAT